MTRPLPLFDTLSNIYENQIAPKKFKKDYQQALEFLRSYDGSQATFNAYRREIERFLHWAWLIQQKSIFTLKRVDIENYLRFCQKLPKTWIGLKKVPRFIEQEGLRVPNPQWRPFVVTLPKAALRQGKQLDIKTYALSETALKEIFAILSSFYNYLIQEEATEINPVAQVRQKNKFLRRRQGKPKVRRLTPLQWDYIIETAEIMATEDPNKHERTLFIITALYTMYLRISELAESERWTPKMGDFYRDQDNQWWFSVVGKGNKERDIAVSQAMLKALKRWRQHLNLSLLPSPADTSPLLPKVKGHGAIRNTSFIRKIVQACFDRAIERLKEDSFIEEATALNEATVHWLRHTGISEDVKRRPREHVRDDAGYSSGAVMDKYINIDLRERYASARNKPLK